MFQVYQAESITNSLERKVTEEEASSVTHNQDRPRLHGVRIKIRMKLSELFCTNTSSMAGLIYQITIGFDRTR